MTDTPKHGDIQGLPSGFNLYANNQWIQISFDNSQQAFYYVTDSVWNENRYIPNGMNTIEMAEFIEHMK